MDEKLKELEMLYKSGRLDRYRYQDALSKLLAAGAITLDQFNLLNSEAVADSILDSQEQ